MENPPVPLKSEDRLWIVLCHLSLLVGAGLLLPLIVYLVKKDESPFVGAHAKEALNFHISFYLYAVISGLLVFALGLGILLLIALGIMSLVCSIMAAIKGSEGGFYKYPLTLRLIP